MSGVEVRRNERDGCQCPPVWVLRCVHFEAQVLRLGDAEAGKPFHDPACNRQHWPVSAAYSVSYGGDLRPARCGCKVTTLWDPDEVDWFPDLPAAEAEFERRAEELRRTPVEERL